MKYYKLTMDMDRTGDIICHYEQDYGIQQNDLIVGEEFDKWDSRFEFFYLREEGYVWTDYLANDKGWFLVSGKLKSILEKMNTEIQFIAVNVREKNNQEVVQEYYIANIVKVVDALCLEESKYFESKIEGMETIYTVIKYAIYGEKTENADVFKLANHQQIPIFVSEKFKKKIIKEGITGISLRPILCT